MPMKSIHRSKYCLIAAVFLFVLMSGGKCYAKRIIAGWEPFTTKTELELRAVSMPSETNILPRDELYNTERVMRIEPYPSDTKNSDMQDILRYGNVSISLSRIVVQHSQIDAQTPRGEGSNNRLNEVKSLTSTFFTSPYKDTFESIGRIFEPQVNLRIEF